LRSATLDGYPGVLKSHSRACRSHGLCHRCLCTGRVGTRTGHRPRSYTRCTTNADGLRDQVSLRHLSALAHGGHMEDRSDLNTASSDLANDSRSRDLSRRDLLRGASVLGAIAVASATRVEAEITSQAIYAKAGPYGGNT